MMKAKAVFMLLLSMAKPFLNQCGFPAHFLSPNRPPRFRSTLFVAADGGAVNPLSNVGVVILAGGSGSRMKAAVPKQFLPLASIPIISHSLKLFTETLPSLNARPLGIAVVMNEEYRSDYTGEWLFADPGKERQGSVENGLKVLRESLPEKEFTHVCVHDSARPLVTVEEVIAVCRDAIAHGSAVLGVPTKSTIKESLDGEFVSKTLKRSTLIEVHTPQVCSVDDLTEGFVRVEKENLEVTDDVSIIELLGKKVKVTRGEYTNIKVTTPEDIDVAEAILRDRA